MPLIQHLQSEFGEAVEVRAALPGDAIDEVAPQTVAAPRDEAAAVALMAWCGREQVAVIARGGGSKIEIGARPSRFDLLLSTEHLNAVIEHDAGNATVTAGAGINLHQLNQAVAQGGQFVPLDFQTEGSAFCGDATLGGVVACNHAGATKVRYGAPRDLVVGLHAALSDGRLVRAGSKVVKNVSGYDLNKLFVGSFGTLGLITQVTLRLRPRDEASALWHADFQSWPGAVSQAMDILDGPFEPALLRLQTRERGLRLLARFDGVAASVNAQTARLPTAEAGDAEGGNNDAANFRDFFMNDAPVQLRAVLPLRLAAAWAQHAERVGATHIMWDCATGTVRASFEQVPDVGALRERAAQNGGALVVERAPAEWKTPDFVWGAPQSDFFLARRLKEKFDAAGVCAPGRFVGGL